MKRKITETSSDYSYDSDSSDENINNYSITKKKNFTINGN